MKFAHSWNCAIWLVFFNYGSLKIRSWSLGPNSNQYGTYLDILTRCQEWSLMFAVTYAQSPMLEAQNPLQLSFILLYSWTSSCLNC